MGDHDTHRGALHPDTGTVTSPCGVTFVPRVLPFGCGLGFSGNPPDPSRYAPRAPGVPGELGAIPAGPPRAPAAARR
ncbi:MAG: hypothetical protein ACRDRS_10210 [Pseudonocardiaceae bacterium]